MTDIEGYGGTPHNESTVGATHERFGVVVPDSMLPVQFADAGRDSYARSPEVRLIVAVLEDAVRCYLRHLDGTRPRARRIFRETEEWFAAEDPEEPFSFVSICAILGIDPDAFRAGLQRQRQPRQARGATRSAPLQTRRVAGDRHSVGVLRTPPRRVRVGR